jgi:hypothetical protein
MTSSWETTEATEEAEIGAEEISVEALVPAEIEVLVEVEVSEAEIPDHARCLVPLAVIAAKNARFLLSPQMANLFIAVNVLKR